MARKTRVSKGKTMRPNFFVFCEGETEISYVKFLRSHYRVPIQIIAKKSDSNISVKFVENSKREYEKTDNDKTFLMFDLDVPDILQRLQKIPKAILLVSNPCFELWILLHLTDIHGPLNTEECLNRLLAKLPDYLKGKFTEEHKKILADNVIAAVSRAKNLRKCENPSSSIYLLIESLS
ncbi:RloB family protein [Succinatimonas hippei]|uniref:RloB family protein n=1 Tax=Succinatimonas hippei TaxID=626938 RepID=UPI002013276E|nr:RloB family protein [Succinatimonas hippei]MCL1603921.1 RloB family protein [Succinatimonas hippei]